MTWNRITKGCPIMKRALYEALGIVVIASLAGFLTNWIHKDSLAISSQRPSITYADDTILTQELPDMQFSPGEPLFVSTEQVQALLESGQAIALDARSEKEYLQAHLPGARHLSFERFYEYMDLVEELDKKTWLITYCGGPPCDLGELLGIELAALGFRVAIYPDGLDAWQDAGLPVETGTGGQL